MNREFIEKATETSSVEELLSLARENNIEMIEEQAQEYYNRFHATGELADDEIIMK